MINETDLIKFLSYGMTRADICDYYNISEPELCEYVEKTFNITLEQLEKQQRANLKMSVYKNLNIWMEKNPRILQYFSDRILGPMENKSSITIVNDVPGTTTDGK